METAGRLTGRASTGNRFSFYVSDISLSPGDIKHHTSKGEGPNNMAQFIGRLRTFDEADGHGFISRGGIPDLFQHHSAIQLSEHRPPTTGDVVMFDIMREQNGLQALTYVSSVGILASTWNIPLQISRERNIRGTCPHRQCKMRRIMSRHPLFYV